MLVVKKLFLRKDWVSRNLGIADIGVVESWFACALMQWTSKTPDKGMGWLLKHGGSLPFTKGMEMASPCPFIPPEAGHQVSFSFSNKGACSGGIMRMRYTLQRASTKFCFLSLSHSIEYLWSV